MRFSVLLVGLTILVAACSRGEEGSSGPDAFDVVSHRSLQKPTNFIDLPVPTPGASNRADLAPQSDLIVALGGRPQGQGIPTSDQALLAHTGRYGIDPDAAAEGLQNTRRGLFARRGILRSNRGEALDAYAEMDRFRAAGVQTPTAPPK